MHAQTLLLHTDNGALWSAAPSADPGFDLPQAYQRALQVARLRTSRGELPCGFKIGFTNRNMWPRYNVFAPIWGPVWNTTLTLCDGAGEVSLRNTCQPRIEPEVVFGMRSTPAPDASLQQLFEAVAWVAPGFEVVQSHLPDWKFVAADCVADGSLHARLLVGRQSPVRALADDAAGLDAVLAGARVRLLKSGVVVDQGVGSNVLDSPLRALHHFLTELRQCPGAPDLIPGHVVTTGTWTDAWPVAPGEHWSAEFSAPLTGLQVRFV